MSGINLFLDSSALVAGILSATGAARALLLLSEGGYIRLIISEQVIAETERAFGRKAPRALPEVRRAILRSGASVLPDPSPEEVEPYRQAIQDPADAPILACAARAQVDFLVTLDRKHFIAAAGAAETSGIKIGTPGDALAWVRARLAAGQEG